MVNHRAQAQFERARWRRTILFPIWTLQLLLTVFMMGLFALWTGFTVKDFAARRHDGIAPAIDLAWQVANVVMSFVATTCTLVEIAKYIGETLTPRTMLIAHVIKLTCASAICILDAVVYARRRAYRFFVVLGLGLETILFITALALAMYAAVTYHRLSRSEDYVLPMNVRAYGFNDGDGDGDGDDVPYSGRRSVGDSIDRLVSRASRRMSTGSVTNRPPGLQNSQTTTESKTVGYYSHERDTQFDEYRARRNSLGSSRREPDRRSSVESRRESLNIGASSSSSSDPSPSPSRAVTAAPQGRRAASYATEHLLGAVPEEEDGMSLRGGYGRLSSDEHLVHDAAAMREVDMTEPRWRREG
ncbi:hypothetical protein E4U42_001346 [Claviceps africana]|uniref:Uncharacterized protein n=1 Tax=Claviceps africana TaxID=83212 RepID=A0A8K0J0X4_9HYPO|nr:hypothetical protein E4U42_001346 [Claviceps africana]